MNYLLGEEIEWQDALHRVTMRISWMECFANLEVAQGHFGEVARLCVPACDEKRVRLNWRASTYLVLREFA